MTLIYVFGIVILAGMVGIIWSQHELNKPEHSE